MENDTITAVSSPPGSSVRGVVRISGPGAIAIAGKFFECEGGAALESVAGHSRVDGVLRPTSDTRVSAAAYVFRAPRSYTREDVVELHVPGSPGLLAMLMDALIAAGARAALAGEFTLRAMQHGAMDLCKAEGIAEMIYARSDAQLRAARRLMEGALSRDAKGAAEELLELRALVEAALDFADEDIEFIRPRELVEKLEGIARRLRETARSDARVERLAEPPRVVLAGPPNAGKSTLLNRLTGMDRAICSPLAGTTRDVLAAPLRLPRGEVMLCDTAGLGEALGEIDDRAHRLAREAIESASLVLWVVDVNAAVRPGEAIERAAAGSMVQVLNKVDAADGRTVEDAVEMLGGGEVMRISAREGMGIERLAAVMDGCVFGDEAGAMEGDAVLLSADLRAAINDSAAAIDRAIELARGSESAMNCAELIAAELTEAAARLGRLTGETDVEQVYDRIFSRFCVGK